MPERITLYPATSTPAFEPDKVTLVTLGDSLATQYDHELDQFLNNGEWESSNMSITFDSYCSGYMYYKGYCLARNFWELLHIQPLGHRVYNSWQTDLCNYKP